MSGAAEQVPDIHSKNAAQTAEAESARKTIIKEFGLMNPKELEYQLNE